VMLVSHDRALLRSVCDEFWLVGRGGVAPFDGDLDDYQRYLLEEARRLREQVAAAGAKAAAAPAGDDAPRLTPQEQRKAQAQQRQQLASRLKPLKKEREQAEQRIAALESEKAALEGRLATVLTPGDIADAGRRLKAVADELGQLEERWLELAGEIEAAEATNG
jgi:ATP-binding cassette, subfamily F, member 3